MHLNGQKDNHNITTHCRIWQVNSFVINLFDRVDFMHNENQLVLISDRRRLQAQRRRLPDIYAMEILQQKNRKHCCCQLSKEALLDAEKFAKNNHSLLCVTKKCSLKHNKKGQREFY